MTQDTVQREAQAFDPFAGPPIASAVPSTEPQREIWAATQIGEDANLAYNESVWLRLRGPLDGAALEAALARVVERHESLRAMFAGDGLTMLFSDRSFVAWKTVDLSRDGESQRAAALESILTEAVTEPFDLLAGPLVRAFRVKLADADHVVALVAHHIVCDGWSTAVILKEWAALYSAEVRRVAGGGPTAVLPPAPRFADYARHLADPARRPEEDANVDYWVKRFADGEIPVLDLPTDRPRPAMKTYASLREDHVIDETLVTALKKLGAKERASLFNVLLAGYYALLARLSGQEDLVVGIPAAGQSTASQDLLVGHCVSMLPLRTMARFDRPFRELLGQARTTLLDAYDHQGFTLGTLLTKLPIRRDPARLPLVSTIFNVDRGLAPNDLPFEGLSVELHTNARRFENYEIFLNAVELGGKVTLECQYNSDLFDRATIRRWLAAYERLLRGAVEDAGCSVGKLPLLSSDEAQLAERINIEAVRAFSRDVCVTDLVFAQVAKTPDAIAVEHEGQRVTYAELDARARGVAKALRESGVVRGELVGLCVERSVDMVVGLLGILEAGGAYVPLDPGYPADRLAFMVSDAKMRSIVTQRTLAADLPFLRDVRAVLVEDAKPSSGARTARVSGPEDPCYVIYTSGSTGKPKGVLVPHRAVANLVQSVAERPGMTSRDVILAVTTLSFDIAVSEIILPLVVGAKIVLASREVASDGERLLALLRASKATFVDATPATWRLLLAAGWEGGEGLKVICTGEAMPKDLAEALVTRAASVWNGYGPTETTVWSTFWEVTRPIRSILIGKPVANTTLYVLDPRGERVPVGVTGELFIGGAGVTLGYHERDELTRERFVADPFAAGGPGTARVYKTGDLVRMLPDGNLECLGRNDNQVKVRGYRIELGEIENALGLHEAVRQAAVTVREDRPGDVRIVGYLVAVGTPSDGDLRAHLKRTLPEYMVPQAFVRLEKMPLTPSGKIDRKALPAPSADAPRDDQSFVEPSTDTERMLAALWQEVLGIGRVGANDDFFALGGHSLLASQMLARLKRDHGVILTFRKIFEAPTIAKLAAAIDGDQRGKDAPRPVASIPRRASDAPVALTMAQRRLWMLEEMDPGQRDVHVLHATWSLDGKLDTAILQRAVDEIVQRHDQLRTAFVRGAGEPLQVMIPDRRVVISHEDLTHLPVAEREAAMRERIERDAEPFDLEKDVLVRIVLIRMSDERHVLFTLRHNIIWDGWSFDIFLNELAALYSAFITGAPSPLPALPIAYADYAAWQPASLDAPEMRAQVDYWTRKLAGNPQPLDIPTDRPRTATRGARGGNTGITISRTKADALTTLAREQGATLYMVVLAIFDVLLHRYTGQTDVLVGTPVRARTLPETEDIIGPFINAVALRTRVEPQMSFLELLAHVRDTTLDAFSHQEMPLELLGEKAPVVRAFFSLQDARNRPPGLGPVAVTQLHSLGNFAANELMLWTMETRTHLLAMLNYATDLFDEATVKRLLSHLDRLVDGVLANPRASVGELSLVPPEEEERIARFTAPGPLAAQSSLAFALAGGSNEARRARKIARVLGVRAGERVKLSLPHGPDAALAAAAAIGAGATLVLGREAADREITSLAAGEIDAASDAALASIDPTTPAFVLRGIVVTHEQAAVALTGLVAALAVPMSAPAEAPSDEAGLFAILASLASGGRIDTRADRLANVLFARDVALPIAAGATGARRTYAHVLPGMRIAVRDAAGHAVPIGVAGSLSVEHPGPARGTRDRVRILEGGAIAHVGRTDGQVDVGGELVDTASMASSLSQHASIAAAHVVAVDRDDEVALAAYVVPRQGADVTHADLRRHLRDRGFDVVPRGFVEVDALPYAEGGAVDEDRLPSAWSERAEEMQEPRTDAEKYMASLWRDVLGVSRISVHDNFFAVGGHSLLCFRVVARVEQERGVRVSPRALLTGSLEQVAALLGDSAAPNAASSDVTTPRENGSRPSQQPASWLERVRSLVRR